MLKLSSFMFFRFSGAAAIVCLLGTGASGQWGVDFPSLQEPEATESVTAGPVAQPVINPESGTEIPGDIQLPNLDVSAIGIEDSTEVDRPIATDSVSVNSGAVNSEAGQANQTANVVLSDETPTRDSSALSASKNDLVNAATKEDPAPSALSSVDPVNNSASEPTDDAQTESARPESVSLPEIQSNEADSILSQSTTLDSRPLSKPLFPANQSDSLPETTVQLPQTPTDPSSLVAAHSEAPVAAAAEYGELSTRIQALEDLLSKQKADADSKKKKDKCKPSVKVGGRLHMDSCWFNQNDASMARAGDFSDGAEIRRARIGVQGEYMEQFRYKMDFDFAPAADDIICKDAYAEIIKLPIVSDFRIGYFKESISMEQLTSSNDTWFIERPISNTGMLEYVMDRSLGMSIGNASKKEDYLWNIGVYRPGSDRSMKYNNDNDGWGVTMRFARLLYEDPCIGGNLHLGIGYSYRSWDENSSMNWGTRVESNLSKRIITTGNFLGTESSHMLAPEFMYTYGSFAVQAEYYLACLQNDKYDNPNFTGGYVQVGYWLTGERYNYEKGKGVFGRVQPCHSFFRMCDGNNLLWGPGAWQLVYRLSWLDLSNIKGTSDVSEIGTAYDHTFGLNWQLNNNTRFMFNYINSTDKYTYGAVNKKGYVDVFSAAFQLVY